MKDKAPQLPPPWIPGLGPRPTVAELDLLRVEYGGGEELDVATRGLVTGARLFDSGYFWEAHEIWEEVWMGERTTGSGGAEKVRGLILLAAIAVKTLQGRPARQGAMLTRAAACLEQSDSRLERRWSELIGAARRVQRSWQAEWQETGALTASSVADARLNVSGP